MCYYYYYYYYYYSYFDPKFHTLGFTCRSYMLGRIVAHLWSTHFPQTASDIVSWKFTAKTTSTVCQLQSTGYTAHTVSSLSKLVGARDSVGLITFLCCLQFTSVRTSQVPLSVWTNSTFQRFNSSPQSGDWEHGVRNRKTRKHGNTACYCYQQ